MIEVIEQELNDHIRMTTEEYTKRYSGNSREEIISKAIAILKLAANYSEE